MSFAPDGQWQADSASCVLVRIHASFSREAELSAAGTRHWRHRNKAGDAPVLPRLDAGSVPGGDPEAAIEAHSS